MKVNELSRQKGRVLGSRQSMNVAVDCIETFSGLALVSGQRGETIISVSVVPHSEGCDGVRASVHVLMNLTA